jgi:hypothetical protein
MIIHPPVRKSKYFFSKITNEDRKPITLKIPYAAIQQLISLSNQQGYLVYLNLNQEQNAVKNIESKCIEELIKNNGKWFHNSLDEDKIKDLFESTLNNDILHAYISFLRTNISLPNYTEIPEWYNNVKSRLPQSYYITLICDGLFIYPTRFGLRWIIHSIKEFKEENDEIIPDYDDIIHYWQEKVDVTKKLLSSRLEKIDLLMAQIKRKEFSEKEIEELKALL